MVCKSTNCEACGEECFVSELKQVRLGGWHVNLCLSCHLDDTFDSYKKAAISISSTLPGAARQLFLEANDILTSFAQAGPDVAIEPMEGLVQEAVNILRQQDPNYFDGVSRIVVQQSGPDYGHVESGQDKDPSIINVNFGRIKSEVEQAMAGSSQEQIHDTIIEAIIDTLAHEKGHVASFDEQQGFVGGETPAEAEQQRIQQLRG